MKHFIISDTFDFAPSSRVYTDNGFLRVTGKAARTGVYKYLASELGLTDRPANDIVNVLRDADEVFNADSIVTYQNVDVTNDHPDKLVDSKNYKSVSVGHVIDAKQDGDFVEVNLMIKDALAIAAIEAGKSQLSPGYTAVYVEERGTFDATGETYEFKQTGIDVNHVAIVKRGRGGAQVRIDDNQGVTPMIKIMFDGKPLEVADEASAKLVTDAFEQLTKRVIDAEAKADKAEAEKDAKMEELEEEKAKTNDAAITARVETVMTALDQARAVAGDKFTCDSLNVVEIQRAALLAKRPTVDWAAKSESYIEAAFDMAFNDVDANAEQMKQVSKDFAGNQSPKTENKLTRDQAYAASLGGRWKGAQK